MEPKKFKSIVDELMVLTSRKMPNRRQFYDANDQDNLKLKCRTRTDQCGRCFQQVENQVITISKERRTTTHPIWMKKCNVCNDKWNLPIKITNNSTRQDEIKSL